MTGEWILFYIVAALLFLGMISFTAAVFGVYRFGFATNRIHGAGIGDTAGLFLVILSLLVATGFHLDYLKLALIVLFMWMTSPVSSHFLSQIEYYTNPNLYRYMRLEGEKGGSLQPEEKGEANGNE